jgi:Asp-tRNA(Asn)/Glu-tRNA(Gln) amidotransferase A subunit family amidase
MFDLDDEELWHGAPIPLQLIGMPFEDEKLLAVGEVVDGVLRQTSS